MYIYRRSERAFNDIFYTKSITPVVKENVLYTFYQNLSCTCDDFRLLQVYNYIIL